MIEIIFSFIWPDSKAERVLGLIVLSLFISGLIGPLRVESRQLLNWSYYFVPVISAVLFWIFIALRQFNSAFSIDQLLCPQIFYGIVFSPIYWRLGISDSFIFGFISITARFVFGMGILLTLGASHLLKVRLLGIKRLEKEERPSFSLLPRNKTLSYFAHILGEWGLMTLSLFFIYGLAIKSWSVMNDIAFIYPITVSVLFFFSPVLLSLHRTETLFWLLVILFCLLMFWGALLNVEGLSFLMIQSYFFLLFGLSVIYPLEAAYHHVVLVCMVLLPLVIQTILGARDIFGSKSIESFITTVAIPLLVAVLGAYLSAKWSISKATSTKIFLSVGEVAKEAGISKKQVYTLLRTGRIRGQKVAGTWVVKRSAFDEYFRKVQP